MAVTYRELDWYSAPRYYDLVFSSLSEREGEFLSAVHDEYAPRGRRRVLEPACGSGRLLEILAARDFAVSGFDLSGPMVGYAKDRLRKAGLSARVRVGDMASFRMRERFEMAHCLVSSFKYLLTEEQATSHLQSVADVLVPGGIYVLGFHLSDYGCKKEESERWVAKKDELSVSCTITSQPPSRRRRSERIRSRLVVREGKNVDRFETNWTFRTYDEGEVLALLARVPAFEHVATYDMSYDLDREQVFGSEQLDQVLILRKRR